MRVHTTTAATVLLLATLSGCGDGGSDNDDKAADGKKSAASKEVDCTDEYLSQKEWMDHCAEDGAGTGGDGTDGLAKTRKLGEPAQTIGDGGTGVLQITPDTLVYVKKSGTETAENGVFAVVTLKDKAMTGAAADEVPPAGGGSWKWMAADGETIDEGGGESYNIVVDRYNNEDPVQPGTYQRRLRAFDLTPTQAKGGTLIYVDGEETAHRWKVPATDSGPDAAELKKQQAD